MSQLRTRKPTGKIPYPFVLVEGLEGSGKTYSQLALSAHPRVAEAYHLDLGEGSADEYASLGSYLVVEHNGTFGDILTQVTAVKERAREVMNADPDKVVLLTVDSVTAVWSMLCDQAQTTANERAARKGRHTDTADISMDLWNKAKRAWRALIDELMTFPGIVVVSARGKEVAVVENGKPVAGATQWKVEAEKSLGYDVNVWVRFTGHQQAVLVKARSLKPELAIPSGRVLPLPNLDLGVLIFDKMGCGTDPTATRQVTELADNDGVYVNNAKKALLEALVNADPTADHKALAGQKWAQFEKVNGQAEFYPTAKVDELVKSVAA